MNQKIYRNSYAANANMHVTLKSYSVYAVNHTMNLSFIFAAINAKTGSMVVVWVFCNVKRKALTNIFALIVKRTILSISRT